MTAHVFVVNERTMNVHLKFGFVGTGAKEIDLDFNNSSTSTLSRGEEKTLTSMMADANRVRSGDRIFFYVQADTNNEGRLYGSFAAIENGGFIESGHASEYLKDQLGKSLTFRTLIRPLEVFPSGISEWEALTNLQGLDHPSELIWSLIYRKLRGNRGNTMITAFEEARLLSMLRMKNSESVPFNSTAHLQFDSVTREITDGGSSSPYGGHLQASNILPRLLAKKEDKLAYEAHLQAYILKALTDRSNDSLIESLYENHLIHWTGNEVACGVGMQRIDLLTHSTHVSDEIVTAIELKAVSAQEQDLLQLQKYVLWLRQYYIPLMPGRIRPVLLTAEFGPRSHSKFLAFKDALVAWNSDPSLRGPRILWLTHRAESETLVFRKEL